MKYDCNYSEFDIKKHNENYINYCEVAIAPDGKINYAHPSHQQFLINLLCKERKCDMFQLEKQIPKEYYCDLLDWLMKETNYILVWYNFYKGKPNEKQKESLKALIDNKCVNFKMEKQKNEKI